MPALTHTFPFIPDHIFHFWKHLHPNPGCGFILGSGASSLNDHIVYMSLEEPRRIFHVDKTSSKQQIKNFERNVRKGFKPFDVPRYVGYLGFDMGRYFDKGIQRIKIKKDPLGSLLLFMGEYKSLLRLDLKSRSMTLFLFEESSVSRIRQYISKIESSYQKQRKIKNLPNNKGGRRTRSFRFLSSQDFKRKVQTAKKAIQQGDIYQANLSFRFSRSFKADPVRLYERLCRNNPSPYAGLLKNKEEWLISCSPELLFHVKKGVIVTRPIAGTRPRGKTKKMDKIRQGQLLLSPKERAEHIMLVDLERNDLGRVCVPGSVHVTEKYAIERYSHVMHIVSQVQGTLDGKNGPFDAIKALFPGGTITGCPKIKSIEVISRLENEARGPFYGSAGYFSWNGDAKFNILIRTAFLKKKKIHIQAGAGIVADSQSQREYKEILAKAQALREGVLEVDP